MLPVLQPVLLTAAGKKPNGLRRLLNDRTPASCQSGMPNLLPTGTDGQNERTRLRQPPPGLPAVLHHPGRIPNPTMPVLPRRILNAVRFESHYFLDLDLDLHLHLHLHLDLHLDGLRSN